MSLLLQYVEDFHAQVDKLGDPRVANWFLMSSPFPTLAICSLYAYGVKVWGPKLMEHRKPFELKNVLIAYNLFQVIISFWLFYQGGMAGWLTGLYNYRCQPVDYSDDPTAVWMAHLCWYYYMSKFTEFLDTIFFVMRKKFDQISTLHVIHHTIMPMFSWLGVKIVPGGHSTFFGFLNSFVHTIMYSYYLLSALGPQMQKYLWWKKYITTLQIVQFVCILVHALQVLFMECDYPHAFVWVLALNSVLFIFLFRSFYNEAYNRKATKKTKEGRDIHSKQLKQDDLDNNAKYIQTKRNAR
ncbi:hypothetical protein PPYR_11995 [Photinus pyralis]|uniref:Elongation of very long chain fatty acids protein n=1 Tax=Photinus pyralis TaxID=7054 RepID=A0A5N4ACW1_PHOPY|nr:elongation of very long chain fatty acids protein AAEL008004-like [Photinus pyralis]KAB0795156.1 hypothetical protein PPYR_11995 [Photinus pyralis]